MLHVLCAVLAFQSPTNLLSNPSFSSGLSSWTVNPNNTAGCTISQTASFGGHSGVARIDVLGPIDWQHNPPWPYIEQSSVGSWSITPGEVYELRASAYQDLIRGGVGWTALIDFYDSSNHEIVKQDARCNFNSSWTELVTWGQVPPSASSMVVRLFFNAEVTGYVDDIRLYRV